MAHKGIRQYQGDESGNIALGQLGFKVLASSSDASGDGNWVAFKVIGAAADQTAEITTVALQGDPLTITCVTGEIVWGAFKSITAGTLASGVEVLCYYGNPV